MNSFEGIQRVRRRKDHSVGEVVAFDGDHVVVRVDGETKRWAAASVVAIRASAPPRGIPRPTDRMLEVARLHALPPEQGGQTTRQLAAAHGVSIQAVRGWLEKVRVANLESRLANEAK